MDLTEHRDTRLDLDALCRTASSLLPAEGSGDGRVQAHPDARTVRYYQSLGILDRPLGREGRSVIYGYRHLLQVLATKLLQSQGHSLAQVQTALSGASTTQLEDAVSAALGTQTTAADPPPQRTWRTVQLAEGLLLTLDPDLVPDAERLLDAIRTTLDIHLGGPR